MEKTQKQRMVAGELYDAGDPEIQADLAATRAWMVRYNASLGATSAERRQLLAERFRAVGQGAVRISTIVDASFRLIVDSVSTPSWTRWFCAQAKLSMYLNRPRSV
jgi:maltose O-acetyltransferase